MIRASLWRLNLEIPGSGNFGVEYDVTPRWARELLWLGLAMAGLAGVWVARNKENRKPNTE